MVVTVGEFIAVWNDAIDAASVAARFGMTKQSVIVRASKLRRSGFSLKIMPFRKARTLEERFWEKVDKSGDCWLWMASTNPKGYGQLNRGSRGQGMIATHRYSWILHFGDIPTGLCVLHRCDTPRCVRPDHLFLGTILENDQDRDKKGRTCKGEDHAYAKLNESAVLEIRRRRDAGEMLKVLAEEFGVSQGAISHVDRRTTWKHVNIAVLSARKWN